MAQTCKTYHEIQIKMFGIAFVGDTPFRVDCTCKLQRGEGSIIIYGPIEESIEEVINYGITFANEIAGYESREFPDLSRYDLHIRLRLSLFDAPLLGPSYGLLVCLELIRALLRGSEGRELAVTGAIDQTGRVGIIGRAKEKRRAAAIFGAGAIVLPTGNLEFFEQEITQIPVSNIFEAYKAVTYGQTEREDDVRTRPGIRSVRGGPKTIGRPSRRVGSERREVNGLILEE